MTTITYTARRSLMPGHVAGQVYSFSVDVTASERDASAERDDHVALDGTTESILTRIDKQFGFATVPVAPAQMREFLDSCLGGEPFQIEPEDGDSPLTVILTNTSYSERRVAVGRYQFSFDVRVLP